MLLRRPGELPITRLVKSWAQMESLGWFRWSRLEIITLWLKFSLARLVYLPRVVP